MQWKLIHAYFGETYWPKIKTWDNELFAREGRVKITLFKIFPIKFLEELQKRNKEA